MRRVSAGVMKRVPGVRVGPIDGRMRRNTEGEQIVHGSQRPPQTANIDFDNIGLTYKMTLPVVFTVKKTSWAPKPDSEPQFPFFVERSATNALPIYTDYVGGGSKVVTILRKCKGDIAILKEEMEKVVGREVEVRPGKLLVTGNFDKRLKTWLTGLGF